jgi:ATP/maltotriose-dependent transcriptional regulator MalT
MSSAAAADHLVGRDGELDRIAGWINDLSAGRGRAVLIEGEPGIGKTALIRAACALAGRKGCQIFWGGGDELGQALPLSPLLEGLRVRESTTDSRRTTIVRLLRGEFPIANATDLTTTVAEHLLALVDEACSAAPTVLVVDDLQWADQATVAVWSRLARATRSSPLLLVGMARPVPRHPDLVALRRAVGAPGRMRLSPLPEAAVAELVEALAGGKPGTELLRQADGAAGNPLYLTELVAALARAAALAVDDSGVAEVRGKPARSSLSAAIADRLGFLPEPVRMVLRAAALLGVEFHVSDLAALLDRGVVELVPDLDEARAAGVLLDAGEGLAFRHPLIRAALYDDMPGAVRVAWHRDAARALGDAGAPVDRVARQLLPTVGAGTDTDAQVDDWVASWLVDAATQLVGRAPRPAVELLRAAVASTLPGDDRHDLLACRLADALYRVGDTAEAEHVAKTALDQISDPDLVVDLHGTLTQCRAMSGRCAETLDALDRALALPGVGPRQRARLLVLIARTRRDLGELDTAGRVAAQALDEATETGDRWAIGWALHVLILVAGMQGEVRETLPLFDRALTVAEGQPALTDLRLLLQINQAVAYGDLDQYDEALAAARQVRDLADGTGSVVRLTQAHSVLGQLLFDTGGWDDALAEVAAVADDLKDPAVACCDHGIAAVIGFHRGQVAAARRHLATAAPCAERIGSRVIGSLTLARSMEREQAGARAEALAILVTGLGAEAEELEEIEDLLPDAVRLAIDIGDTGTAEDITAKVEKLTAADEVPHRSAAALHCRALLERDPDGLLRAADGYREAGRPLPRAKALEAAAAAFAEEGDRGSARAAYSRAFDVYTELGAARDLDRLQARFRAYGIRRGPRVKHRQERHGWDSLTPTEARVAGLVVQGMSNPQIAAELFLSPRTVGTHVSHILAKLDVHSRIDIAREAGHRYTASG